MSPAEPQRLRELDDPLAELFDGCDDDRVEFDLEAGLGRHRELIAAGAAAPNFELRPPAPAAHIGPLLKIGLGLGLALVVVGVAALVWHGPIDQDPRAPVLAGETAAVVADPPTETAETAETATDPQRAIRPSDGSRPNTDDELVPQDPTPEPREQPKPASASPGSSTARKPAATRPEPSADDDLARELMLIAEARRALEQDRFADALTTARTSLAEFPRGTFVEEALALEILALVGEGELEQARTRAERFRRQHPHSGLVRRVQDAMASP